MALVKFGGGITAMSGSIAGNTFARNRYGNYVRSRTKPVNPNTTRQQAVRAAVAFLTDRWANTLTGAQRTAWGQYASNVVMKNKLGESINLSGFNHYIRSNVISKVALGTTVDAGPIVFEIPAQDPFYTATFSAATGQITTTYDIAMDWADETGAHMFLFQGLPQNRQRNFFAGPWRYFANIVGATGAPPASPDVSVGSFLLGQGQRCWCYARIRRADGRLSETFRDEAVVGA